MRKTVPGWYRLFVVLVGAGLVSCVSEKREQPTTVRVQETVRASANVAGPRVTTDGGVYKAVLAYPTGDSSTSEVVLEKSAPVEVAMGQPFDYEFKVSNVSSADLVDVVLTEKLPAGFTFVKAAPKEMSNDGKYVKWDLGLLKTKETKSVKVTGTYATQGTFEHCGKVEYDPRLCVNVVCINPALSLVKTAPAEVCICDPIPVKLVVKNTGTGRSVNTKVTDTLPDGLTTADGQKSVSFDAGTLDGGQSREFAFNAKAARTGQFTNTASAIADGGLKAQSSAPTTVRRPVLAITKKARRTPVFLGQTFDYEITVTNTGDYPSVQTVLRDEVPGGTTFRSATGGGVLSQGMVVWDLGTLEPKATRNVGVTVSADAIGKVTNTATAEGACAAKVSASATVEVAGIPAILLEVVDEEDPIAVGKNDTYLIVVTNQGSAPGTNIKIVCTLEENAQYLSSSGPTKGSQAGATVTFAPLASLAPKAKAEWKVVVKAVKAGDVRFRVQMTSDQISRPVEETEATNFYE